MTGFIIADKPGGMTSFKAAAVLRRITGEKKTGHTGTLDPMATGVLPVALGHATRFIDFLPDSTKGYRASFLLGETTDTLDITGKALSHSDSIPCEELVLKAVEAFKGEIMQLPPMYSAIKINGQRLYSLARQGVEIEREKRKITVYSVDVVSAGEKEYTIDVKCSKGTYIRSLISDIGEALGCGAVMTALRRTMSNGFEENEAHTLDELENAENINQFILPVDQALKKYPAITVSPAQAKRFGNGGELDVSRLSSPLSESFYRVYSPDGSFKGIGEYQKGGTSLKVKRVFVND